MVHSSFPFTISWLEREWKEMERNSQRMLKYEYSMKWRVTEEQSMPGEIRLK